MSGEGVTAEAGGQGNPSDKLANGVLESVTQEINALDLCSDELRASQKQLHTTLLSQQNEMKQVQELLQAQVSKTFELVPEYQHKLERIMRKMLTLEKRIARLKANSQALKDARKN